MKKEELRKLFTDARFHPRFNYDADFETFFNNLWQLIEDEKEELKKDKDMYLGIAISVVGEEQVEITKDFILGLETLEQAK